MKRPTGWKMWFLVIVGLEVVSFTTVFVPEARAAATIIAGAIMAIVAMRRPDIGLAALFAELVIGSKGALLKIPEGAEVDGGTSFRIVLVGTFLVGWAVNFLRSKPRLKDVKAMIVGREAWVALFVLIAWATVRGAWLKNSFFVSDANAWGYLVLLLPVVDVARRDGKRLLESGKDAFIAALAWLPIKTLALLYIWSHGIKALSQPTYLWVRRTGVGEVTLVTGNLFRVFIQSQVYALVGFLGLLGAPKEFAWSRLIRHVIVGCGISLLIGLSRSLWIGLACGGLALFFLTLKDVGWRAAAGLISRGALAAFVSALFIAVVVAFPFPRVEVGSLTSLFGSRASTGDAAAESRWNLLPVLTSKIKNAPILGSGFGASVTYASKNPRILAQNPDGMYTTYAFEWGWLEFWIKFGILGIPVMLWVLFSIGRRMSRTDDPTWIRNSSVAILVALAALHVFTPYLNHPLGFGILLAMEAMIGESRSTAAHKLDA